jgi:membrane protein insertase Oxa1/YidC/SpoIIIJ
MNDSHKLLLVSPKPPIAGEPLTVTLNQSDLGFDATYLSKVDTITVTVNDTKTKEVETLTLKPAEGQTFQAQLPTVAANTTFNWDVFLLIAIYGLLSWAYQQSMTSMSGQKPDPAKPNDPQAMMNKLMPLMFTALMFVIPIPSGVMLYLLVTMVMMVVQNKVLEYQDKQAEVAKAKDSKPSLSVVDVK